MGSPFDVHQESSIHLVKRELESLIKTKLACDLLPLQYNLVKAQLKSLKSTDIWHTVNNQNQVKSD